MRRSHKANGATDHSKLATSMVDLSIRIVADRWLSVEFQFEDCVKRSPFERPLKWLASSGCPFQVEETIQFVLQTYVTLS